LNSITIMDCSGSVSSVNASGRLNIRRSAALRAALDHPYRAERLVR
jgi:hypothetical protein